MPASRATLMAIQRSQEQGLRDAEAAHEQLMETVRKHLWVMRDNHGCCGLYPSSHEEGCWWVELCEAVGVEA